MRAILFPYTYISAQAVDILRACGRPIVIYHPSSLLVPAHLKAWAAEGTLEVRTPVTGDETRLRAALRDYRGWIDLRGEADTALLKTRLDHIPFFDGASAAQIRTDIQKRLSGAAPAKSPGDLLFSARLFLHLAQDFDLQQEEIRRQLTRIGHIQERLRTSLAPPEDATSRPPGADLTRETVGTAENLAVKRVQAWSRLFLSDPDPSPLFITLSLAVFEHLQHGALDACTIAYREPLPELPAPRTGRSTDDRSWGGDVERILATPPYAHEDSISSRSVPEGIGQRPCLTLCHFPRTAPSFFWRGVAESGFPGGAGGGETEINGTLVGLMEKL